MKRNVTDRLDIELEQTRKVPDTKKARRIQREHEMMQEKSQYFHNTVTEPVERVVGYTREQLYHVVTAPMVVAPYDTLSRGIDTCEKLSIVLQWSGAYVFTWIIGVGYVRVLEVRQKDRYNALVKTVDLYGHEKIYRVNWHQEMHLFLGAS